MKEMGKLMAETIMYIEREEIAGPDYQPKSSEVRKWASQRGSVYIGDQKIRAQHPRLRGPEGEIALESYKKLKDREGFFREGSARCVMPEVCGDCRRCCRGIWSIGQLGISAYHRGNSKAA